MESPMFKSSIWSIMVVCISVMVCAAWGEEPGGVEILPGGFLVAEGIDEFDAHAGFTVEG